MQSVYGLARLAGLGSPFAWAVHGSVGLAAAAATLALWRSGARYELKAAALATAMLVISPYSCIYDLPLLTVPVVFLIRDGLARPLKRGEKLGLGFAYLLPMFFPVFEMPVGPAIYAALGCVLVSRWRTADENRLSASQVACFIRGFGLSYRQGAKTVGQKWV
jgi:hypothetical protein